MSVEDIAADKSFVTDLGADSLDTVELVMELEEEFGIVLSDDESQRLTTVADAIAFLQARRLTS